jgi:hypothetical protein
VEEAVRRLLAARLAKQTARIETAGLFQTRPPIDKWAAAQWPCAMGEIAPDTRPTEAGFLLVNGSFEAVRQARNARAIL